MAARSRGAPPSVCQIQTQGRSAAPLVVAFPIFPAGPLSCNQVNRNDLFCWCPTEHNHPFRAIVVIILSWILHSSGSQLSGPETEVPTTSVGWADTGMAHHHLMERQRLVGGADGGQTPHFQLHSKIRLPSALGQIPTSAPSGIAGTMSHFASDCLPSLCNSQQPVLEISCLTSYVYLNLREN